MFTVWDFFQIVLFVGLLAALTPPLGRVLAKIFRGEKTFLTPVFGGVERLLYRISGVDPLVEMNWKSYTRSLLAFNLIGFLFLFVLQIVQQHLPLNPAQAQGVSWHLAFNTAVSFVTNTNWQSYAGETTLSYLTQMIGLTVQNFVSAASGIAVFLVLVRGFVNKSSWAIGNFWVDLVRTTLYVLLPCAIVLTVLLVGQGVIQNFDGYKHITTIEGATQIVPMGPVASQEAIKQIGSNGGGYFNANSAHPFENPTPLTNLVEMLSILLLASGLVYAFGVLVGSKRQGFVLWGTMMFLFLGGLALSLSAEYHALPLIHAGSYHEASMEGKEMRFGVTNSVLWSVATTAASNGSVNAMHDSFTPLAGMVPMINIMLGELIFGGVGAGMYGILIFVILTVFIAGLMVGRTPEYLGKKIEAFEVKMAMLAVIAPSACILIFTALALSVKAGLAGMLNAGPHGFSEILYAYTSGAGNNGSAFAGISANTPFYNITLGIDMIIGRFGIILPVLAIGGSLAVKKSVPLSAGTFRTDTVLFAILLIGVILIVGGLTFFPALTLGPGIEHLLMQAGHTF